MQAVAAAPDLMAAEGHTATGVLLRGHFWRPEK